MHLPTVTTLHYCSRLHVHTRIPMIGSAVLVSVTEVLHRYLNLEFITIIVHTSLCSLYEYSLYSFEIRRDVTSGRLRISGEVP